MGAFIVLNVGAFNFLRIKELRFYRYNSTAISIGITGQCQRARHKYSVHLPRRWPQPLFVHNDFQQAREPSGREPIGGDEIRQFRRIDRPMPKPAECVVDRLSWSATFSKEESAQKAGAGTLSNTEYQVTSVVIL